MEKVVGKGRVFSGEGAGSFYTTLSWASSQIDEKVGFAPYPGTLNLRLPRDSSIKEDLGSAEGIEIIAPAGFLKARCFHALIMNRIGGAVVTPDKPGYPSDVLEVIAPVNLREALSLEDGDVVELSIFLGRVVNERV